MAATVAGPLALGLGSDAKGLAKMHRLRRGLNAVVLRRHGRRGQRRLGLRRQPHIQLGVLDGRHRQLGFNLDRFQIRLGLRLGDVDLGRFKLHIPGFGSSIGGGGGIFSLGLGGSFLAGMTSSVSSYLC